MPNWRYNKGVKKERKFVNEARKKGQLAFRSAGSHSPIDVCIIDIMNRRVKFVQCKSDNISENQKKRLLERQKYLPGTYEVIFTVE